MSNPDILDRWKWKLRAFFSADVIGSTAYKYSEVGALGNPQWASTFTEFYKEFPVAVERGYANVPESVPDCEAQIEPWKFSGDEILFHVQLANYQHVARHVAAFKVAVRAYSKLWSEKGVGLSLKATAWLAGFPVTNREVNTLGDNSLDFIGPSIDLGFRLSKFATARKFVLSADLALMLLDAVHACDIDWRDFHVLMHGREELKGALGGTSYPIFWLDTTDGAPDLEEELLGAERPFIPHKVREYLRAFLKNTPRVRRPFIDGDTDSRYGTVPGELENVRAEMMIEEGMREYTEEPHDDPDAAEEPLPPLRSPPPPTSPP